MGTISDKLNYLAQTKDAIMNAIIAKGVSILPTDTFRSYAEKISQIVSDGGGNEGVRDIVSVRPNYIDKPRINTGVSAYSETYNNHFTAGSLVQLDNGVATFTGSSNSNLITMEGFYSNNYINLRVKYVNDSNYNPIWACKDAEYETNGVWLYNGKLGSNYAATQNVLEPYVDNDGYMYIQVRFKSTSLPATFQYNVCNAYWTQLHTSGNVVVSSEYPMTFLSPAIGGRINDTYLHTNIDLAASQYGEFIGSMNPIYQKSYILINNNPPEPEF